MTQNANAIGKARTLEEQGEQIMVGSPSIYELFVGVVSADKPASEEAKITAVLSSMTVINLDFQSARAGGIIYGERKKLGKTIDVEDAMLAGIAKTKVETILTRNSKHFLDIEGVSVEPY
jgi:predicted nucleic acid-binding protein